MKLPDVAAGTGFSYGYVGRVKNGLVAPSEDFREALAAFFGLPVTDLFTSAALDATYTVRLGAKGLRRDGADA